MRWIVPEKRAAIYIRDGFTCCYCGTDLRNASRADIGLDHLISRNHGGSNHATNLSTCCGLCNSTKGTQNYTEYAAGGSLVRIERTRMQPVNIDLGRALIEGYGPSWESWAEAEHAEAEQAEYMIEDEDRDDTARICAARLAVYRAASRYGISIADMQIDHVLGNGPVSYAVHMVCKPSFYAADLLSAILRDSFMTFGPIHPVMTGLYTIAKG